ncbi:ryncolin-1-like [Lucilia cuprina]|uniref:ryncolin-1-like n=1 Tax=Lucilia cuprina TaxID=7375 RepID=UPI001F06177E|nr:ryncolin-1-like [Lucilia cuprina]
MLKLKTFSYISSIIFAYFVIYNASVNAESEECKNIIIEGGEQALKKIFNDFNEIKNIVEELKSNNEEKEDSMKDISIFDERIDKMPKKCNTTELPKDCAAATACTKRSGIYKIKVEQYSTEPFYVACDSETEAGDWLIVQKRQDGSEDFYRNWQDYENGFGDIEGEFFIGLKKLHALTTYNGLQELLIVMEGAKNSKAFAKYDAFAIGNGTVAYELKRLGKYSGTAGNSLQIHVGMKFSTKDHDNDKSNGSCANNYTGAWWYKNCHESNLNGKYGENTNSKGINWKAFRGFTESLSYVKMMIRRSRTI